MSIDNDPRRQFIGQDSHQNSPSHHSDATQVSGYTENTPWNAQNPPVQRGDPRLGPGASHLYDKSVVQFGQPMMNTGPPAAAVSQGATTASETSAPSIGTAPQAAVTPGWFIFNFSCHLIAYNVLICLVLLKSTHLPVLI